MRRMAWDGKMFSDIEELDTGSKGLSKSSGIRGSSTAYAKASRGRLLDKIAEIVTQRV